MGPFRVSILRALLFAALLAIACGLFAPASHGQFRGEPDVEIELDQFGLGNVFRPGDIVPMRLRLTNNPAGRLDEAVMVWVQWEAPNADGDIVGYGRPVTLTRGRPTPVWLYAPVPQGTASDTIWAVRVFEMRDGQRRGEIGGRRVRPMDFGSSPETPGTGMIAVIGQRHLGLNQYQTVREDRSPAAHERTRVVFGVRPDQLPDNWKALTAYEAIAWGAASPLELTTDTAAALREYVRRGGHLIIVLPEDANPWQFGARAQTPLHDVLPAREPRKDAAVSISAMLPIMSKSRSLRDGAPDFTMGVRFFKDIRGDFDAIDPPYEPLIALPDGRVLAVQRTLGHGRITIVGLDISYQRLYGLPLANTTIGLPQADVFWNRILGRRMDTPTGGELQAMHEERLLAGARAANANDLATGTGLITGWISMPGQAVLGLLLALLLFTVYWIVAGPGGFAMLKLYRSAHHAWLAFAGAAGLFTVIAWGAVGMMRINEPRIEHITVLDHVVRPGDELRPEDPQFQRAVSWLSLYTPGYNRVNVSLDSDRQQRDVLLPWTPPEGLHRFPNADRFTVNVAEPQAFLEMPSRSTATLLYANWLGGLDAEWGRMIRSEPHAPVDVLLDGGGREHSLRGRLTHNFAGPLRDVTIIWVRNLRLPPRRYAVRDDEERQWITPINSGQMLNPGHMWRLGAHWHPGEAIDLSTFDATGATLLAPTIFRRYVEDFRSPRYLTPATLSDGDRRRYMEMLSIFQQLTPPEYVKSRPDDREPDNVFFHRRLGRELDLSPWFNRPALIIIGFLDNSETPLPIRVGGELGRKPASEGVTIVRWIYPLPLIEDIAFPPEREEEDW